MKSPIKILQSVGLNEKEALVYSCLLEYGDQTAGLISKKTDINRSTCYIILDKLKQKALVSSYKKKETLFFSSEDIEGIVSFLNQKKEKIEKDLNSFNENKKILKELTHTSTIKPKVKFYEGLEGVKKVYLDTLKNNNSKEILGFYGQNFYPDELNEFIKNEYLPLRLKKNIEFRVITEANIFEEFDIEQLRKRAYFNSDEFPVEAEINIYNDKVAFISYSQKNYIGVIIEDTKITNAIRMMHQLTWSSLL